MHSLCWQVLALVAWLSGGTDQPEAPPVAAEAAGASVGVQASRPVAVAAPGWSVPDAGGRLLGPLEIALEAEAAWRDEQAPGDRHGALLVAAKARAELGHKAHAAAYLRAYVAARPGDREAARMLSAVNAELTPLDVTVWADPNDAVIQLNLLFHGRPADALPPLIVPLVAEGGGRHHASVPLTVGSWTVVLPEDGYYDEQAADIAVAAGSRPPPLEFTVTGTVPAGQRPRYIGVRAGASPFVLGVVGLGLTIGGQSQYRSTLRTGSDACTTDATSCRQLLTSALILRSTGTALLGASLGVTTALLSGRVRTRRGRAIAWGVDAGLGLAAVIGGAIGVHRSARELSQLPGGLAWSDPAYQNPATRAAAQHSGTAFVLGFGSTVLVYSAYYFIRDQLNAHVGAARRRNRSTRVLALAPAGAG